MDEIWYGNSSLSWFLWPLSLVYRLICWCRRGYYRIKKKYICPVPLIIVGNITVGGVGKTPVVIALVKSFQAKGLRVGVVSRGYGALIKNFPHYIETTDTARDVGDEPYLIARKTGCPVVIAPRRTDAVIYLLQRFNVQIIISDDGLQHYAMDRAIEIIVIDGVRGVGNGMCLPAGPLREMPSRLKETDFLIVNGGKWANAYGMQLIAGDLICLTDGKSYAAAEIKSPIAAIAGIGHPERFFTTLNAAGIVATPYIFPDHHLFSAKDFAMAETCLVMTEKDAVKCQAFAKDSWYFLPVEAQIEDAFWQALFTHEKLKGLVVHEKKTVD